MYGKKSVNIQADRITLGWRGEFRELLALLALNFKRLAPIKEARRKAMVIERVTGGKPQEVRKTEQGAEKPRRADSDKGQPDKAAKNADAPVSAQVSERSKAAIKAYRIATETKPDISRAQRVAEIKLQVSKGTYKPSSTDIADAIVKSVVKES